MSDTKQTGTLKIGYKGRGFVTLENDPETIIEIEVENLGTAMHNDTVEVADNKVISIVNRAKTQFVGLVYRRDDGRLTVIPDDRKCYAPFWIKTPPTDVKPGEKVIINFDQWLNPLDLPEATIIKDLGKQGEHEVEIQSIVAERGLPVDFPPEVDAEAAKIAETWKEDMAREALTRRDFRKILTFTIDPADAKDFDDALSIQKLANGNWEIGVHIADVSHYVRPGTILDGESSKRATSIYLVDRTIPCFPKCYPMKFVV
jgi:VacB/RNase II family 3'-5' exoribonuclease